MRDSDQSLLAAGEKGLGFLRPDPDPHCSSLPRAKLASSPEQMAPVVSGAPSCFPGCCARTGELLGPIARPMLCHFAGSLSTCSGAVLGSPTYHYLPNPHAMMWVLLLGLSFTLTWLGEGTPCPDTHCLLHASLGASKLQTCQVVP